MRLAFRRPATPPGPTPAQRIADLQLRNAELRAQLDAARSHEQNLLATVAYQNGRMREMASQILGSQVVIARYQKVAETWTAVDAALGTNVPSPPCAVCPHARAQHDGWGCTVMYPGAQPCRCQVALTHFDKAKAAA